MIYQMFVRYNTGQALIFILDLDTICSVSMETKLKNPFNFFKNINLTRFAYLKIYKIVST